MVVHVAMVMGVSMETGMADTLFLKLFLFVKAMQHLEELTNEWLGGTHTHTHNVKEVFIKNGFVSIEQRRRLIV